MNPAAHPLFVAAEVEYRFERDRIVRDPAAPRPRTGWLRGLLARRVRPRRQHTPVRTRARSA